MTRPRLDARHHLAARPSLFPSPRTAGPAALLLGAVIAIELAIVAINVMLNQWNNRFYNALQDRNWDAFVSELLFFCVLAAAFIVLAVYQLYLNQWLQIRWRRWMTQHYLDHWLDGANHYRMQLLGDAADNPDQRIAEDIKHVRRAHACPIGVGLLSAIVTLGSFVVILWALSATAPLHAVRHDLSTIPGYLVWAALIYAVVGTLLTHLIGWPLIALNFKPAALTRPTSASTSCACGRIPSRSRCCDGETAETRAAARPLRPRGRQLAC